MNVKRFQFLLTLAIAVLMMAGLLALLSGSLSRTAHAQGTIRYVAPGGSCGGASPCYSTVQDAVDAAQPEDEIRVAAGTYTGINNYGGLAQVVYVDKSLTIRGGYTTSNWNTPYPEASPTELNATIQGRVMVVTGTVDVIVEGLRLTYGNADGLGGHGSSGTDAGAGLYIRGAVVSINHSEVLSSAVSDGNGGGVYLYGGSLDMDSSTIQGNSAANGGGLAIYKSTVALADSHISHNTGTTMLSSGGGLFMDDSTATIRNNTFADNDATQGGGLWVEDSEGTLSGNFVEGNRAGNAMGGGIQVERSGSLLLTSNTIQNNSAMGYLGLGGGVRLTYADSTLISNTIRNNKANGSGGGVSIQGGAHLYGNVIEDNTVNWNGAGVSIVYSDADDASTLTANVIRGNNAESSGYPGKGGGVHLSLSDGVTLTRNLVQNNEAHQGWSGLGDAKGGGICIRHSDAVLINNIVTDNWAENAGSGLQIEGSDPLLYHTTIANNTGGDGSGVRVVKGDSDEPSQPELYNTIIANQTTGVYASGDVLNVVRLDGVLWWGNTDNTAGGGTFFIFNDIPPGDPAFVNTAGYDYHIGTGSVAVDTGIDAGITDDVDGQTRPHYEGYDLGADEWWPLVAVKTATPDTVEPGDVVTYTLTLTNATDAAMTVSLTDTLPTQVSYLGPLTYNNGSGGYASGVITWTGTVLTSTPTFIIWPVQVASDVSGGTSIASIATVSDAYGLFQTDPALIMVSQSYHYIYLPAVLKNYR